MKWAISSLSFPGALEKKIAAAAQAGFRGVELFYEDLVQCGAKTRRIAQYARELGVDIVSLQSLRDFEAAPEAQRAWNRKRAERTLDLAAELGASMLVVCANTRADTINDADLAAADLARLADMAAARKLKIAYEALSTSRFVRTFAAAAKIVAKAGRANLGLVFGTAHTHFAGGSFDEIDAIDPKRLFLVHLADAPKVQMDVRLLIDNFRLFPGQGDLPLRAFYDRLVAMNYHGPLSLEVYNGQMRGMSPRQIATDGVRAMKLLAGAEEQSRDAVQSVAFIEIACFDQDKAKLVQILASLGFARTHVHRSKRVSLWRQGGVNIVINEDPDGPASSFYSLNGLSACALAYNVEGMSGLAQRLNVFAADKFENRVGPGEMSIPGIRGADGGFVYFIDQASEKRFYEADFVAVADSRPATVQPFVDVDHFSQIVMPHEFYMALLYYRCILGFHFGEQVGVLDPHGTVLSRNIRSSNGRIQFSLTATYGPNTTTQRFLSSHFASGYQHFAFRCEDIFAFAATVDQNLVLKIPDSYYDLLGLRFDLGAELIQSIRRLNILYDQDPAGRYFQMYTVDLNGLFFEVVQRDGYAGFGAANAPVRMAAQTRDDEAEQNVIFSIAND